MKKTIFLAAMAALYTLVSCQKEDTMLRDSNGDLIFTASIAGPETRTSINTTDGKVSWVTGDEITITDAKSNSVVYVVDVSTVDSNGKATFTKKDGETGTLRDGPYTATYLADFFPAKDEKNERVFSDFDWKSIPSLPMSGSSTISNPSDLIFKVNCGLVEFHITSSASTLTLSHCYMKCEETKTSFVLCFTIDLPAKGSEPEIVYFPLPPGVYSCWFGGSSGDTDFKSITVCENEIYPINAQLTIEMN